LLCSFKDHAGFSEVTFHKRLPVAKDLPKLKALIARGAKLCVDEDKVSDFEALGLEPSMIHEEALAKASVVVDCTPSGVGISNKNEFYENYLATCKGFIAQGSEFGFGKMYATGINDSALEISKDRFVQVVSCNTHNICALVNSVALVDGTDNLEEAASSAYEGLMTSARPRGTFRLRTWANTAIRVRHAPRSGRISPLQDYEP